MTSIPFSLRGKLYSCDVCGSQFQPIRHNQKRCGGDSSLSRCQMIAMLRQRPSLRGLPGFKELVPEAGIFPKRACRWCGGMFTALPSNKVFCSPGHASSLAKSLKRKSKTKRVFKDVSTVKAPKPDYISEIRPPFIIRKEYPKLKALAKAKIIPDYALHKAEAVSEQAWRKKAQNNNDRIMAKWS